jgi:hypothetical protein
VGTTCWFQELDIPAGVMVTYDPATPSGDAGVATVPPEPPPDGGVVGTVSVTNTFTTGSLIIEKEVSGPGVPAFSQGPFVFGVSCDYQGVEDVFSVAVVVPGSTDGSTVQSEPVTGLPIGAVCTVTEIDNGGADIVTPPQTVTIEENEQANVAFVGVNNPFSAGSVSVVKAVDGTAATSAYVAGLRYTVEVECAVETPAGRVTVLDDEVVVAGDGVPVTVTNDDGMPTLVPFGARCWGAEPNGQGANTVTIDHNSFETGVEVVADAEGGVQPLQINVTNTFNLAELTITKYTVNAPDPAATYTFDVACTVEAGGTTVPVPLIGATSPVVVAGGQTVTVSTLAGARCVITERDVAGATVTIAEAGGASGGSSTDGVVTLTAGAAVAFTNTFPAGTGGSGGLLPFTGGSGPASIVFVAVVLTIAGIALVVMRRRVRAVRA